MTSYHTIVFIYLASLEGVFMHYVIGEVCHDVVRTIQRCRCMKIIVKYKTTIIINSIHTAFVCANSNYSGGKVNANLGGNLLV